jgi:hypothetical protein
MRSMHCAHSMQSSAENSRGAWGSSYAIKWLSNSPFCPLSLKGHPNRKACIQVRDVYARCMQGVCYFLRWNSPFGEIVMKMDYSSGVHQQECIEPKLLCLADHSQSIVLNSMGAKVGKVKQLRCGQSSERWSRHRSTRPRSF